MAGHAPQSPGHEEQLSLVPHFALPQVSAHSPQSDRQVEQPSPAGPSHFPSPHVVGQAPQSAAQVAHVSLAPQAPLPHDDGQAPQSDGHPAQPSDSPQVPSPQRSTHMPQSFEHVAQLSEASQAPSPQLAGQTPQSRSQLPQFSGDEQVPSPQRAEQDNPQRVLASLRQTSSQPTLQQNTSTEHVAVTQLEQPRSKGPATVHTSWAQPGQLPQSAEQVAQSSVPLHEPSPHTMGHAPQSLSQV